VRARWYVEEAEEAALVLRMRPRDGVTDIDAVELHALAGQRVEDQEAVAHDDIGRQVGGAGST